MNLHDKNREAMVETQIVQSGIRDKRVIKAMATVPREAFVPTKYLNLAYSDQAVPIGHNQTISQPYVVALMVELLRLLPTDRVLEIGTGSGYCAAVLSQICKQVYSIEIVAPLLQEARERLNRLGYKNIQFKRGDGNLGWPEEAPFDAIILTAAPETIPEGLFEQLKDGGYLVGPAGLPNMQSLMRYKKVGQGVEEEPVGFVSFVPMMTGA